MKKQVLLAGIVLLVITSFASCKKEFEKNTLRGKIAGKWAVNKIEVATAGGTTVTTNYTANDYIDFKDTESDDFEWSLGTDNRQIGAWTTLSDGISLYLDFSNKDLDCKVTSITDNKLQFTGTVVGSTPKVTETYYLSR